jgi:hypothetical protein
LEHFWDTFPTFMKHIVFDRTASQVKQSLVKYNV